MDEKGENSIQPFSYFSFPSAKCKIYQTGNIYMLLRIKEGCMPLQEKCLLNQLWLEWQSLEGYPRQGSWDFSLLEPYVAAEMEHGCQHL